MGTLAQLVAQNDVVYRSSYKKFVNDEVALNLFLRRATAKHAQSTFDALESTLSLGWQKTYDIVYPFGDAREGQYISSWVFDFVHGVLYLHKIDSSYRIPLSTFHSRHVTLADFEPCDLPVPPALNIQDDFPGPYWDPALSVSLRNKALISRLLQDLNFQWQTVFRSQYSPLTFRKLARAVLQILKLDFKVIEDTAWRYSLGNPLVRLTDLPQWDPLENQVATFGTLTFVAAQDLQEGISQARALASNQSPSYHGSHNRQNDTREKLYLVTSIRDVVLCRYIGTTLEYTQPEAFLSGWTAVSDRAINLLLFAMPATISQTRLHNLPVELQDNILIHVSQGPVEPARVGCALGLGSPFMWRDNRVRIDTEHADTSRRKDTPVESQIWFGGHRTGIVYRLDYRDLPGHETLLPEPVEKYFPIKGCHI